MQAKIIGGTVVTSEKAFRADIAIDKGKIKKIAPAITDETQETIDATDQFILPGGIDVHTHFDMPFGGTVTSDDFFTGTVASACGGTTSIIDFAIQEKGKSLKDAIDLWHQKADNKSVVDYGFHIAITDLNEDTWDELHTLTTQGISSIKVFLAYKNSLMINDETIFKLLQESTKFGLLVMAHCENGDVIDVLTKQLLEEGKTLPIYHALSRPAELEDEATHRAIKLAGVANAPLYIVHLSSQGALESVRQAHLNKQPVYAETCPHYLVLSMDQYSKPAFEGAKYVMSPPLRGKHHQAALWKGLAEKTLSVIGSDHCAFNFRSQTSASGGKELGKDDFSKIPNGIPGVETRLPLLYSEGVTKNKINLNQLVDMTSTMPAKLFGLYPTKGEIAEGSDADIVIINPKKRIELTVNKLHQNVDYCPYEGMRLKGMIYHVLLRGTTIVRKGSFLGAKGMGEFLKRRAFKL